MVAGLLHSPDSQRDTGKGKRAQTMKLDDFKPSENVEDRRSQGGGMGFPGGGRRGGGMNIPIGMGRGGFSFKTILFLIVVYFIVKFVFGIDLMLDGTLGTLRVALPQAAVENIMLVPIAELIRAGTRMFLRDGDKTLTVARLGGLLGLKAPRELPPRLPLLVLRTAGAKVALLCSQILGEEELILRPLPPELREHDLLSAVALSPSGAALFVLSLPALLQEARTVESMVFAAAPEAAKKAPVPAIPVVLVADDSITTRTLLRSVLEAGGYLVHTAADGDEALTLLRSEKVDLVVSDVRMPRLDGLGLISRMRADQRTRTVPVVLFSSLDSEEERRRGEAAGAAAYLSKSAFERGQLFEVVAGLLGRAQ